MQWKQVVPTVLVLLLAGCATPDGDDGGAGGSDGGDGDVPEGVEPAVFGFGQFVGFRDNVQQDALQDLDAEILLEVPSGPSYLGAATITVRVQRYPDPVREGDFELGDEATDDTFMATVVKDEDGSYTEANPTMTAGDIVRTRIDLAAAGVTIEPSSKFTFHITPEHGDCEVIVYVSPDSYGAETRIEMDPFAEGGDCPGS